MPNKYTPRIPLEQRFWSKVRKTETCWIWTASLGHSGYGKIAQGGRTSPMLAAHRVAWELANGPIPDGMYICHHCDTPCCVNPSHLFLGTPMSNMADKMAKGRHPCGDNSWSRTHRERVARGERNGHAKATLQQVAAIRAEYSLGFISQKSLGMKYGLSQSGIWGIVNYKHWRDFPK